MVEDSGHTKFRESKPLAGGTREKIRDAMSSVFNHAIRWEFTDRNPIAGPTRGSGVRVSGKREQTPDILEVEEMQRILAALGLRESHGFLDMPSGLRRGELAGLQWGDLDFKNLHVSVTRSLVDQHVGPVKTEASRKLMPIDEYVARDLSPGTISLHTKIRLIMCGRPMRIAPGLNVGNSRWG